MVRLATHIWVDALLRRVSTAGASAFIVQRGDAARGDVLVKVARLDGTARIFAPRIDPEGGRVFQSLDAQGAGPDEVSADAYIRRARERDADLWVIEIEDPEGRHFLTDPVTD